MIVFKRLNQFEKGLIYKLLCESYASLVEAKPDYKHEFETNWQETDDDLFDGSNSSGKAVISTLYGKPIGFVSWYVEGKEVGSIGHNCMVPFHCRKGYGKRQVHMALDELLPQVHRVKVTTANHPFFLPARRTYLSCGFVEIGRSQTESYGGFELIHFELARK